MAAKDKNLDGARDARLHIAESPPGQAPAWSAHDRSFAVEGELVLRLTDGQLGYEVARVAPYVKTYADEGPPAASEDGEIEGDEHCFVAWLGGEVRLSRH